MTPRSLKGVLLAVLAAFPALALLPAEALAATRTSSTNGGFWSVTTTWNGGVVPVAGDDVVIASGVVLDTGAACANGAAVCAIALTINAGGSLSLEPGNAMARFDCTSGGTCAPISGTLLIGPGQTVKMQANDNSDRIVAANGGRVIAHGQVLWSGTVTAVITDPLTITDTDLAFGLPRQDFEFEDAGAHFPTTTADVSAWANADDCVDNCYVIRFLTGELAGRWFNTKAPASIPNKRMKVDYNSRFNPACGATGAGPGNPATCGAGLTTAAGSDGYGSAYTTGTACLSATSGGACVGDGLSGQWVTGTGVAWTTRMANGSRWYCNAEGPGSAVRIIRVDLAGATATAIKLERAVTGGSCDAAAAAYAIVDDNQPYPFADHSEHIKPGDTYEIIRPATIQGAVITTGAEPDGSAQTPQSEIVCQSGSLCHFEYASLKWMGRENSGNGAITATNWNGVLKNSEIVNYGGGYGLGFDTTTSSNIVIEGNFIHHPYISNVTNNNHAIGIGSTATPGVVTTPIVRNNRFDLISDDAIWIHGPTGPTGGSTTGGRITKNIFKYIGNRLTVDTAQCVSVSDLDAVPATSLYNNDLLITDNDCWNEGGSGGNGLESATDGAGITWSVAPGKPVTMGIEGNRVANVQNGTGIGYDGGPQGTEVTADYTGSTVTVAGNYVSHTAFNGIFGGHNILDNIVYAYGLDREVAVVSGIVNGTAKVRGNLVLDLNENLTTDSYPASASRSALTLESTYNGSTPSPNPFQYASTLTVSDNLLYGNGLALRIGSTGAPFCTTPGTGLAGSPALTVERNYVDCVAATPSAGNNTGIDSWLPDTSAPATITRNVVVGCLDGNLYKRGCGGAIPDPAETFNQLVAGTAATGFTVSGTDTNGPLMSVPSNAYQILSALDSLAGTTGPRAAGFSTLTVPQTYGVTANSTANAKDTDGDGVLDLHDNCKSVFNPTQADRNGNNKGDACD